MGAREEIQIVADELRSIANLGLLYARREARPHDEERYERVLRLAARLLALADSRDAAEILRAYSGDLGHITPSVCADAALFDDAGRIFLAQRSDSGLWCIPGGFVDVGETPAEAAEREMREETGLSVRATDLIAIYDNRRLGSAQAVHAYHLLFACAYVAGEPRLNHETLAVGYFPPDALPPLTPDHEPKVERAFQRHAGLVRGTYFH